MLLSCSLLIRINGSHDTAFLLSFIQPPFGSHLTFNHVTLRCTKEKACVETKVLRRFLDSFLSRQANTLVVFSDLPVFDDFSRFLDTNTKGLLD